MDSAKKFVVGLTGGIGSGKSAAAAVFKTLGINIVNADELSREVVEPGQPALEAIAKHFGADMIQEDGSLDRAAMRSRVFAHPKQKKWLESLLHPLIAELIQERLHKGEAPYSILETPLLFETEQVRLVDRTLAIDASEETQLERALARDGSDPDTIRSIIASQIPRMERLAAADDVVSNEGSLEDLEAEMQVLHRNYLGFAKTK